ncbi:hypothetical protein HYX00_02070 [Candidatus Woesearchaeota archaeon]|nr:hypothetical protein [Candidatus Woesearchaeota archaeon]
MIEKQSTTVYKKSIVGMIIGNFFVFLLGCMIILLFFDILKNVKDTYLFFLEIFVLAYLIYILPIYYNFYRVYRIVVNSNNSIEFCSPFKRVIIFPREIKSINYRHFWLGGSNLVTIKNDKGKIRFGDDGEFHNFFINLLKNHRLKKLVTEYLGVFKKSRVKMI